jgi:succinyl-CoA synthetase alpha subunit
MYRRGLGDFKYFVGMGSLAQVATREDRVCVLNILGGESSGVTPVSHAYSGGNVAFGTSPGRRGQALETPLGNVPVYNNVLEGLKDGHRFNCGVVYLPPSAARDGVAELIRVNPELKKIFIVTEKLAVHDSREIRAMGQGNGIDIFGANSLGVADAWEHVRIGGALGGDRPEEALRRGSIAIFSNSGNFTSTIATYLRMAGWGTTTLKAAVLYVEPGGFYEFDANFSKPIIACVVGRWKSKLTRAVGHAGALAGGGDDAASKERWFMEKLGVEGIYTPDKPVYSVKGALVTNIAHIPAALTAVLRENGCRPDFEPEGSLALKPWFASSCGLTLPPELDLPAIEAVAPYNEQIAALNRQIGAVPARQSMKDTSGASHMDPTTQVTSLYGVSMLKAAQYPLEANVNLALLHEPGGINDRHLINVAIAANLNLHGHPALAAAQAARDAGNAPNSVLAAASAILGPRCQGTARQAVRMLTDSFAAAGLTDAQDESFDTGRLADVDSSLLLCKEPDAAAQAVLAGLQARGAKSVFVAYLRSLPGYPTADAVLAAVTTTLAWGPLMRKRVSRLTVECLPWWMRLFGALIGASVPADQHRPDQFCGMAMTDILQRRALGEVAFVALLGLTPSPTDLFSFEVLVGLLLSNGPGTISAQGAKGAVSADGPEDPERVQLNKALTGFLTHTGFTHGGNGYEGVAFLIERFRDSDLVDPGDPNHGIDLSALAARYVEDYARYKSNKKHSGSLNVQKIPGVNHPVFKDKPVNHDPREVFVRELFAGRQEYNVFHEFYRTLVQALFDSGVSRNIYCVNVDAVISALLLKMLWRPHQSGLYQSSALETAAFTIFLYPRMLGCAAEIDDHMNRGRNMDTRTPAANCHFLA